MQSASNYDRLAQLIEGLDALRPGDYARSSVSGFMDLHLDVLQRDARGLVIALSHTFEMNGDRVPDPDMEIRVTPATRLVEALAYQDQFCYRRVAVDGDVDMRARRELNRFLAFWLGNCLAQGHRLKVTRDAQ